MANKNPQLSRPLVNLTANPAGSTDTTKKQIKTDTKPADKKTPPPVSGQK